MEEGGGSSIKEIEERIEAWNTLGCPRFADLQKFHAQIKMPQFFTPPVQGQNTWMGLITILLSALGNEPYDPPAERLKNYQASSSWGCSDGDTLLMELLPLPAPSVKHWLYQELSDLPELRSRDIYRNARAPKRADEIKQLVDEYKPKVVVFYSSDEWYQQWWRQIADAPFRNVSANGILVAQRDGITFLNVDHPVSPGSQDYFLEVGRIADLESAAGAAPTPKSYSVWKPGEPPRRSIYRRFWTGLFSNPSAAPGQYVPVLMAFMEARSSAEAPYSTKGLPTSFVHALSIAGKWAVVQCNIPLRGRSGTETAALQRLVKELSGQTIFKPYTPFTHETCQINGQDFLLIKREFRRELVDEAAWPALHSQMRIAMAQLQTILYDFL